MADIKEKPVRIVLWYVPRSVSVALTKCLSAIPGMEIWFETFGYCGMTRRIYQITYRKDIPMEYPGNEKEAHKGATLFEKIVRSRIEPDRIIYGNVKQRFEASSSKYVMTKEMFASFPDETSRKYMPSDCRHVFIIRDPYKTFNSYRKAIYQQLKDVGIRSGTRDDEVAFDLREDDPSIDPSEMFVGLHEIWKYVKENHDPEPVIINTDDLLTKPAEVLSKFCLQTGLPYSESLLQWDPSPEITRKWKAAGDNVIMDVEAFYKRAIYSSCFLPPTPVPPRETLTPDVLQLAEDAMPYFHEMNEFKI